MKRLAYYIFLGYTLLIQIGCSSEVNKQLEPKGAALGKMNEIIVIADKAVWESAVGDTFQYYFESAYPILPQPEPIFDLRHFTIEELNGQPLRKELRTYVILSDLSDAESPTTRMVKRDLGSEKYGAAMKGGDRFSSVGRDKWARGQLLVYLYAPDRNKLQKAITSGFPAIATRVHKHDEKQLRSSVYVDRVNSGISDRVRDNFGIDFDVPGDFSVAIENKDDNVLWLRKIGDKADQNIVLQKIKYTNQSQLTKEGIISMRNKFGSTYVTSDEENDVMVVDEENLPVYEYNLNMDGHYGKELRGIWEMTNTFSGGPFTTYVILKEATNEILYIDVFVLAPGTTKRNLMMQLNHIVKSANIIGAPKGTQNGE